MTVAMALRRILSLLAALLLVHLAAASHTLHLDQHTDFDDSGVRDASHGRIWQVGRPPWLPLPLVVRCIRTPLPALGWRCLHACKYVYANAPSHESNTCAKYAR